MIPGVAASQGRIATSGDPYWSSVVLLMKMDGNVFNEKTTQFSTVGTVAWGAGKFGQAMSLSTGTSGALADSSSSDFGLPSDYTIECFIKPSSRVDGAIISHFNTSGLDSPGWQIYYNTSGKIDFYQFSGGGDYLIRGSAVLPLDDFTHVAVSRVSGVVSLYVGGLFGGSVNNSVIYGNTGLRMSIGYQFQGGARYPFRGLIDEVRITRGVGRYTTSFTPPSLPFPSS